METIPRMNLYRRVDHIVKSGSKRNLNCLDDRATEVDDLEHSVSVKSHTTGTMRSLEKQSIPERHSVNDYRSAIIRNAYPAMEKEL